MILAALAALTTAVPAAEPVPLSPDFYSALSTHRAPEQAADLRRGLRANLVSLYGEAWDSDCEEAQQASGAPPGLQRQRLPDGSWLLSMACSQGAYQGSFWAVHLWRNAGRVQAALLAWPVAGATGQLHDERVLAGEMVVLKNGQIQVLTRFRGIGDCGTRSRYGLHQGRIRILELAGVLDCPDTAAAVGPDQWPVLRRFAP